MAKNLRDVLSPADRAFILKSFETLLDSVEGKGSCVGGFVPISGDMKQPLLIVLIGPQHPMFETLMTKVFTEAWLEPDESN